MTKEEKILREYFTFKDINGSETIECLPLTLVDMLIEYKQTINNGQARADYCKHFHIWKKCRTWKGTWNCDPECKLHDEKIPDWANKS